MANPEPEQPEHPMRLFVVLNPAAGFGDSARVKRRLAAFAEKYGWQLEVYETREDEDLRPVVAGALKNGAGLVVAAGGDGTVSAVAAGMVGSGVPLAILPVGTGNLLAHDLGIPGEINRALEVLAGDHALQTRDAMEINGRHYVLNVGVGFSSMIIQNTARQDKRRFGMLAYLWTASKSLFGLQPQSFRLVVDGKKLRLRASEILIANGGLLGVKIPFEDVRVLPDDGQIDLFVIKARNLWDYLELLYYIIRRKPRAAPKMLYLQASGQVQIASKNALPTQADGEVIGKTPVAIRVVPRAVQVVIPAKGSEALVVRLRQLVHK
jgi:YegS/Rv2252/BmrU family lipid kinase